MDTFSMGPMLIHPEGSKFDAFTEKGAEAEVNRTLAEIFPKRKKAAKEKRVVKKKGRRK